MIEKDIGSLQKVFTYANRKKDEAYNTILRLKRQYGEEVPMITSSKYFYLFILM